MTKTSIKKELLAYNGGHPFMSLTDIRTCLHIGKDSCRALMKDVPYILHGKRKDYLVEDIAEKLASIKTCD